MSRGAQSPAGLPLIIGHRGASSHAPENTFAAFNLAFLWGADGIEFDVRLARDGVPVVMHDASLRRTTGTQARTTSNGRGARNRPVSVRGDASGRPGHTSAQATANHRPRARWRTRAHVVLLVTGRSSLRTASSSRAR